MPAQIGDIQEMLNDTLIAIGIDVMTYTKGLNPALDGALHELDEWRIYQMYPTSQC